MAQGNLRKAFGVKITLENTPETDEYYRFKEKMNKCENQICREL